MTVRTTLADQHCEPCRGGIPPLSGLALDDLLAQVPDWSLRDGVRIERRLRFTTFAHVLAFVNAISRLAEAEQHHPDICFGWGYASVSLQTKAIKGLHGNDFVLAAKIDGLLAAADGRLSDVNSR